MYTASDLRKGLRIKIDNDPYIVTEFNFVKPGKGQALYRCKLKNMINGNQFERTFRSVDVFEAADLQEKKMQYLYKEEGKYCFMDNQSYEQVFLTEEQVGEAKNFLLDNIEVEILLFEDRPLGISLPNFIDVIGDQGRSLGQGRFRVGEHQTGDRPDGLSAPGSPLHRRGGKDPDRYPQRGVPHPGQGMIGGWMMIRGSWPPRRMPSGSAPR